MKVIQFVLAVCVSVFVSTATAQTEQTTGNLVTNTWSGAINYTGSGGGTSGGASAGYNSSTGTIYFGYTQQTVNQLIGINTALQGSGLQVNGYNWSWEVYNNNGGRTDQSGVDTLTANIFTLSPSNQVLHTFSQTYNTKFNWTTFSGTQTYTNPYQATDLGNIQLQFSGRDTGFWAGYYGPQVRNINVGLRYTVDPCVTNPQSSPSCPGYKTFYNIPDDGHAIVPIPFGFPLYGETFTHSIFFSNGAVSFYSPTQPQRWAGGGFGGINVDNNLPSSYFYTIMPLNTDLINYSGAFYTQGDNTQLKYTWENISQFGRPNSRNTFSLEIQPTGYIGLQYNQIDVQGGWSSGIVGNASLGEFINFNPAAGYAFNVPETIAADCSDPLNNVNCPGYQQAFLSQQCNLDTLYSPSCPGYASAFLDYQCSFNALYSTTCVGYDTAYLQQQCALNALHSNQCAGYADAYYVQQCNLDPLYDSGCTGYDQAYFNQQCSLDGLYDRTCPNYNEAYAKQQLLEPKVEETVTTVAAVITPEPVTTQVVIEQPTPTASVSPADVSAPVQLIAQSPVEANTNVTSTSTSSSSTNTTAAPTAQNQNQPRTTRQQLAQARIEAQRAKAAEEGAAASQNMDSAASLEDQVAVQNVVLQAMGFNAAFDAYSKVFVPDGQMYKPFTIYDKQKNVDNQRLMRGLTGGSDRLHMEMVNGQYR